MQPGSFSGPHGSAQELRPSNDSDAATPGAVVEEVSVLPSHLSQHLADVMARPEHVTPHRLPQPHRVRLMPGRSSNGTAGGGREVGAGRREMRMVKVPQQSGNGGGTGSGGQKEARTVGPLDYNGGPVMTERINVYVIYYGDWKGDFGHRVFKGFINSIDYKIQNQAVPSIWEWWRIMEPYYMTSSDGSRTPLSMSARMAKAWAVNTNYRTTLNDGGNGSPNDIQNIVTTFLERQWLPVDASGVYFVVTSAEIKVMSGDAPGFCSYCGWHNDFDYQGTAIKYSFVGDPTQQCNGCGCNNNMQTTINGYYSMDTLMCTVAHELAETVSDPEPPSGWSSSTGENADMCEGDYSDPNTPGLPITNSQGYYNTQGKNGLKFLVVPNVDIKTSQCVLRR